MTWRNIAAALSPIIGTRGVAALYKRSLHLASADYSWLAPVHDGTLASAAFTPLQSALSLRTAEEAAAASSAVLHAFNDLLTSLIGPSLTARLLRPPDDTPTSPPPPEQETPP